MLPKVAYLLPYTSNVAAKCLGRLLQEDYRVHVAREAFQLNGTGLPRVAQWWFRVNENKADLHERDCNPRRVRRC